MLAGVVRLALGDQHSIILQEDGSVWSTAVTSEGHIPSDGKRFTRIIPSGATDADAGIGYSIALMHDGSVWSTSKSSAGPLGDEIMASEHALSFVQMIPGATGVAAGGYHSVVVTRHGRVRAMGWNKYGQLGDGSTTDRNRFFVVISHGKKVLAVAAGDIHTVVLKEGGSLWATGRNDNGQLGDGSMMDRTAFSKVTTSGPAAVGAGGYHSMVVPETGRSQFKSFSVGYDGR